MFSTLPDLTPRDAHALWYTSSRNPFAHQPGYGHPADLSGPAADGQGNNGNAGANPRQRMGQHAGALIIERSALGRLREDERNNERRRANVSNLGSTWLKPPGVTKTLFQLREERREMEEHAEAMRREMLAQELAEAEAAAPGPAGVMVEGGQEPAVMGMDGDGDGDERMGMMGGEDDGGRDLDDDIPDADEGAFGFDGASDDDEDDEDGEDDDEDRSDTGALGGGGEGRQLRRVQQRELQSRMASMRATENRMREVMARGGQVPTASGDLYGADEDIDEEDQAHILEEEDLVSSMYPEEMEPGMEDMDMDANLDDDIPEAEETGGYEHTDSEASLSSDDETGHNISYGGMRAPQLPPPRNSIAAGPGPRSSMAGGLGPRSSLDISSILSRDGSSMMGSSPRLQRRG